MRSRIGAWCTVSPVRRTGRRSQASSTMRCAGAPRVPTSWVINTRARCCSACCGSSASSTAKRSRRAPMAAALRRRKAAAIGARRDRFAVELALEPQHAEQHRARVLITHDVGTRGAPAQRIVDEACDRRPVRRTGETVHQAPILERIRRRTTLRLDVGDHFDGRGNASAGRHQIPSRMRIMKISHMIVRTNAPSPNTGPRRFTSLSVTWM